MSGVNVRNLGETSASEGRLLATLIVTGLSGPKLRASEKVAVVPDSLVSSVLES